MFNVKQFVGVLLVEAAIAVVVVKVRDYGRHKYNQGKIDGLLEGGATKFEESEETAE